MPEPVLPAAAARGPRRRLSLVWLVPLVAALAAGWLGWRTLAARGPTIEITFASAEGLEAGKTRIKHNDVELGLVESLVPSADLTQVVVVARMIKVAESHLTEGTRFWVVRPRFSVEGISGLGTLVSGAYVELDPGAGAPARRFVGLEEPPVVAASEPGTSYRLRATRLGSIGARAPIYYRGLRVGQVLGTDLSDADGSVAVQIFVRAPHDQLVHEGSRFWNASGITLSAGSDGFKLQAESLWALLAGGIDFDVPAGAEPGAVAPQDAAFTLYDDAGAAADATYTRKVRFLLHFAGAVQNLKAGADVRMQGMRIGDVTDVHIEFDAASDQVSVPVTIEVEPERVRILNAPPTMEDFEQNAYAAFARLVARGLRARLASANLITGQKIVTLDFVPSIAAANRAEGGALPEIPTVDSDDIDAVIGAAKTLLGSLQTTVETLNKVVASPALGRAIGSLDTALANVDRITRDVRNAGVGPFIAQLRTVADSADAALRQANSTIATAGGALDGGGGSSLAGTMHELQAAARSIRLLADYLETHPESLISGRAEAKRR